MHGHLIIIVIKTLYRYQLWLTVSLSSFLARERITFITDIGYLLYYFGCLLIGAIVIDQDDTTSSFDDYFRVIEIAILCHVAAVHTTVTQSELLQTFSEASTKPLTADISRYRTHILLSDKIAGCYCSFVF